MGFSSQTRPKARKLHQCDGCRCTIEIGEVYMRSCGTYDGDFYAVAMCSTCEVIYGKVWASMDSIDQEGGLDLAEDMVTRKDDDSLKALWLANRDARRTWGEAINAVVGVRKRTDAEYIDFDPYFDDCTVTCRTVRIVTTRAVHQCFSTVDGKLHEIPPGTKARFESARVDGEWGKYYSCLDCLDKYLDQFEEEAE